MRTEQLFVKISWVCLVSLPLLPPFFFVRVPQSSSVQNRFNKHFQDTWAVKGYADLVHNGVAFIGIITQERDEEFPHFICFGKQAFRDLPWATAELNRKFRIMVNAFPFWAGFTIVILTFFHSSEAAHGGDKEKTEGHGIREWFGLEGTLRILCSDPLPWGSGIYFLGQGVSVKYRINTDYLALGTLLLVHKAAAFLSSHRGRNHMGHAMSSTKQALGGFPPFGKLPCPSSPPVTRHWKIGMEIAG